jgi:competence protein ComEA
MTGFRESSRAAEGKGMKKTLLMSLAAALFLNFALAAGTAQKKTLPAKPLDLNTATAEELQQLPGIGATLSRAIVHLREKSGPFRRVEDLLAVPHITRKTIEKIRPFVTVGLKK